MIGSRGILAMFLLVSLVTIMVMGFSDKLKPCDIKKIDHCAQTGGLNR